MLDNFIYAAGAVSGAAVGFLAFKYPDRAVFQEVRPTIPHVKGLPLVGTLFEQISNIDRYYDAQIDGLEKLDSMTTMNSSAFLPLVVLTIDPRNIEYFLKTNFSNYVKGHDIEYSMQRLFGNGIFVANGEKWKLQRKTASRIFNVLNFRDQFSGVFIDVLKVVTEQVLDPSVGQVIDFQELMFKFTLDTFVQIGFGTQLGVLTHKGTVDFAESFDVCQRHCDDLFLNPFQHLFDTVMPFLRPHVKSIHQHYDTVDKFAYSMIEQRRREMARGRQFKDLMSQFMEARDDDGKALSDKDLRDTVLNLIIAGRDTTAVTLTWTLYCLMIHPRVENKLLQEINDKLPNQDLSSAEYYEAVKSMTYAHAVFYEVLRLYPAVPSNIKMPLNDDVWPDGTHIKKGDTVSWSSFAMARSSKVWGNDAKDFKPERWIADDGQIIHESQGKWPVFHAGPRVCLGQQLATLQAIITLTTLLRRYKFSLVSNQKFNYFVSITMPIKDGLKVFVERR